mmetsp:Transcript_37183/g.74022  ORF Transcript_37183/g.74022 Transcript_37183/m.74022 type:complete len:204 (-) Transcript_37183:338-949(-)
MSPSLRRLISLKRPGPPEGRRRDSDKSSPRVFASPMARAKEDAWLRSSADDSSATSPSPGSKEGPANGSSSSSKAASAVQGRAPSKPTTGLGTSVMSKARCSDNTARQRMVGGVASKSGLNSKRTVWLTSPPTDTILTIFSTKMSGRVRSMSQMKKASPLSATLSVNLQRVYGGLPTSSTSLATFGCLILHQYMMCTSQIGFP